MNKMNKREHYLQAMGVTRWRLRESLVPPFSIYTCRLIAPENPEYGWLAAELSNSEPEKKAELELLAGIIKALQLKSEPAPALPENFNPSRLILLGEHLTAQYSRLNPSQRTQTHSLKNMLDNPALKSAVWKELKTHILIS